jgi:hypothetical protein
LLAQKAVDTVAKESLVGLAMLGSQLQANQENRFRWGSDDDGSVGKQCGMTAVKTSAGPLARQKRAPDRACWMARKSSHAIGNTSSLQCNLYAALAKSCAALA